MPARAGIASGAAVAVATGVVVIGIDASQSGIASIGRAGVCIDAYQWSTADA
jgi:hypothetical protein